MAETKTKTNTNDSWLSLPVAMTGGLILNVDTLTQGTQLPGSARILQNYECAIEGGYKRIAGYTKYDSNAVTGGTNNPVLGVKVALSGVFACRKNVAATDNSIYYSTGSGWTQVNTTLRPGSPTKARFITYSISAPVVIQCDGVNYAWKWDGTTETTINGAGAPATPKYAAMWRNRLVLGGYTANTSAISVSAPNADTDFTAAAGAFEINVGDVVVGLKTFRETLYIFCVNSIKKLVGNTTEDILLLDVADKIGCISGDTIQEIGGDLIFLAPDGFRSLAATERSEDLELGLVSKQIQPIIRNMLATALNVDKYSSFIIRKKSQYRVMLNDTSAIEAETIGFIGKFTDRDTSGSNYWWSTTLGMKPYCADSDFNNNQEVYVMGHPTSGYVYRFESGNSFDGTDIYYIYRSPDIVFGDATLRKVFQKITLYTQADGDIAFTLNLLLDREQSNILQPSSISMAQSGAVSVYGSGLYGTATYSAIQYPIFNKNLIGSGFTGAIQISGNDSTAQHRIDSFQVQYGLKSRR